MTTPRSHPMLGIALWLLLAAGLTWAAASAQGYFDARLQQHWHVSGWGLFLYSAILTAGLSRGVRRASDRLASSAAADAAAPLGVSRPFFWAVCGLTGCYLLHTGVRAPEGGMEWVLTFLFAAFVISTLGLHAWPQRAGRCLFVQLAAAYALLPLGLLHGVLAHAHGFLADQAGLKA
ncbi:MAG: hypothetical protein AAF581_18050 [Planctomycetota bacterium]